MNIHRRQHVMVRAVYCEPPVASIVEPLERRMLLDAIPAGPEFRVNTHTTMHQRFADTAMDADGDFVVAWESEGQDGSSHGIYAQRYSAAGVAQGPEFRVNTHTTDSQRVPSVARDAAGDFVVAWESSGQDGSSIGIYAQRYNAAGVTQGSEFRVNTFTTSVQANPAVAMDADGDFVIAWYSRYQDGSGEGIYAQRYNTAGVAQGGEFRVSTSTPGNQIFPAVAMDDDGDFVVAWRSAFDGDGYGIDAQRYNAAGVAQGAEFRVNTFTTNSQSAQKVAMDANGDFVVTWSSFNQDASDFGFGIYAQRYNAAGVAQGAEFRVNTFTTGLQDAPAVAIDADGDFVVTWFSNQQDGDFYGVFAQCYNPAGVAQGAEFRVNTFTTNSQASSAVAMNADGDFVVTWQSNGQDGSNYGIYAQRYAGSVAPAVSSSTFLFQTAPHRVRFVFTQNVSGSLSTGDLVLQNLTTGQTIPSSQLSLSYAAGTNTATFTYTGNAGGISGVLPDGNYRATLLAAGITNPFGRAMAANHIFNFFFLNGDASRDGRVNVNDFNIVAANYGQSPRNFTQGDFTYDSLVNLADYNILASKFGSVLAAEMFGQGRINPIADAEDDALAMALR